MTTSSARSLAAPVLLGVARVALGILWLHEGFVKWHAGFGKADILLVADGAKSNTRIPEYFEFFAEHLLGPTAGLAGIVVPVVEVGLGIALIAGVLTLPVALVSLLNLMTYWASDQLVGQYPAMGALSAVLIAWPALAEQTSVPALLASRRRAGSAQFSAA